MTLRRFDPSELTGPLIKAARVLAKMGSAEFAATTGLGERTIKRAEASGDQLRLTRVNLEKIAEVLSDRGVIFVAGDEEAGPGVRLKTDGVVVKASVLDKQR